MLLGTRKRGHAGGGGGGPALLGNHGLRSYGRPDPPGLSGGFGIGVSVGGGGVVGGGGGGGHGDNCLSAALLDALGLGSFARLDLPAPPDELDLAATVKPSSNCIIVSMGVNSITVSPPDLAAALSLRLGTVALPEEVSAAMFSSVEAIAAVREFVHDRLLLGGTGDGQVLPEETVAALRLVEEGKAYMVDWGWLVWAVLRSDVLIGQRRRCSRFLLRLMMCLKPDLFSLDDGRFPGKRRKGLILQQEQNLLHRNRGYDQFMAAQAGAEEGSVFGMTKNIGELVKMPAFRYVKDQQHRVDTEDQEDVSDDNANVNVFPSLLSFYASRQQVLAHVSNMENATLDIERTLEQNLAEIHHMKEKEDKDNEINYIMEETKKELEARSAKMNQLEYEKMVMVNTLHGFKKMFKESEAAFLEYRKMMCEKNGASSLDDVADKKNHARSMQLQGQAHEIINGIQRLLLLKCSACATDIKALATKLADLNNEVQKLKDSRSIPDLNLWPHL